MKRSKSAIALSLATIAAVTAVGLIGCGGDPTAITEYELSAYTGYNKDVSGKTVYNTELFYSNSLKQGYPDPQVFDDTARTGYYYLYGTSDHQTMRSKDLAVWEPVRIIFDRSSTEEIRYALNDCNWAPEMAYDKDTKLYYYFFSALPAGATATGNGVATWWSGASYNMYVATSASPTGPFTLVDFSDPASCGIDNLHNDNTETNVVISENDALSGKYAYVKSDDTYYKAAFAENWVKYCLFSPEEFNKVMQKNGVGASGGSTIKTPSAQYFGTIDPHPFIDPATGDKYLYFKVENGEKGWNINIGVPMDNWLKPDWSKAEYVTVSEFYSVEEWRKGEDLSGVSYETGGTYVCNEGACVLYHKDAQGRDMYYFTFSVNDYQSSQYQVGMAVSYDGPLGPFRKLYEYEGGLLLCSSTTESNSVSGAGHHSFVTVGDQIYIAYHRHRNFDNPDADRYTAIDEIKFITVKDKDGNDMEIPYVNGPTDSIQPLPETISGYKNVAAQANVTCTDEQAELEYLTDGLLSVHKTANDDFMSFIRETKITETATFEFAFASATSVRAIMIYNSAMEDTMFKNVSKIEFTLADGSVKVIRDVKFDIEQYCILGGQNQDRVTYVLSGAAAFAEFYDVDVTNIKITVEVPKAQEEVGISEIKILGKA